MFSNPRSSEPDMQVITSEVILSGSHYTVVTIGGKDVPEGIAIEEAESMVNEYGEFPIGQDTEYGIFYWTTSVYIHHPEVEGALQVLERGFHGNKYSAMAHHDRAKEQLRNPLAIAAGIDVAGEVTIEDLRAMLSE